MTDKTRMPIKVEINFLPVEQKQMPRGHDFLVLFMDDGKPDFGRAFIEESATQGEDGTVWHDSMSWSYDDCENLKITHWAEIPTLFKEEERA